MAEIKWIKITTDIFDDEKIRIIERMPEGDAILIIWLKFLTLAGKKNDCGLVYLTEAIPYTPEILSDIFNRDSRLISLAMNTFISFGMIVIEDDIIKVLNWEKHQNIEGMNKIREQTRKRVAKHREVKQIERCNVTVTKSNATDKNKIRLEGDKKEKENKDINTLAVVSESPIKNNIKDSEFELFWKSYPKGRGNKKLSLIQWKKKDIPDNIMDILGKWKLSDKWKDQQYILHCERWIKDEHWLDDIPANTGKVDQYNMSNGTKTVKGFGDE